MAVGRGAGLTAQHIWGARAGLAVSAHAVWRGRGPSDVSRRRAADQRDWKIRLGRYVNRFDGLWLLDYVEGSGLTDPVLDIR